MKEAVGRVVRHEVWPILIKGKKSYRKLTGVLELNLIIKLIFERNKFQTASRYLDSFINY
jgi:hypothetical protein